MEDKLCPYCYKSIKGSMVDTTENLICPRCEKRIPKMYLQHPVRHIASITNSKKLSDYSNEINQMAKSGMVEYSNSRVEYVESEEDNVKFILFEYLQEEFSRKTETEVLVFHFSRCDEQTGLPKEDIRYASAILLNFDITELRALYFNTGVERSLKDFNEWFPAQNGAFIRELSYYLQTEQMLKKTAILFGNMHEIRNYPFYEQDPSYQSLLTIMREWTSDYNDRVWIKDSDKVIRRLLAELGEERFMKDADSLSDMRFLLYPDSKHRMVSNMFWMMAVLLWICVRIEDN